MNERERYIHRIFAEIESGQHLSQRSLARQLGIALGLTNFLVRSLVRKGWVKAVKIRPNQVRYLLTPRGMVKKARLSRQHLRNSIKFYAETRDRIRSSFTRLSSEWPQHSETAIVKRIMFYGTGDVAEIGYVCLQETDLQLMGAIDDCGRRKFFGLPLHPQEQCTTPFTAIPFDKIVVLSFGERHVIQRRLDAMGVEPDRIFWV